jgi:hypothetical protein
MEEGISRRTALKALTAVTAAAGAATLAAGSGAEAASEAGSGRNDYLRPDADRLRLLYRQLAAIPRKRSFETLPMIARKPQQWDSAPLEALLAYGGTHKQVFDTTDIAGTWITQIRNTVNAQVWAFDHPDFLVVAAPHGSAGLALFSQKMWTKYQLAAQTGGAFKRNTFLEDPPFPRSAVNEPENAKGLYSDAGNFIPTLRKRGVVFLSCHNAIWELASVLIAGGYNPDGLKQQELVADLTNNLIPGVITTPGNEATIGMLQQAGFVYSYADS